MGGRDQVLVRGAGVDNVLHTVRIAVITQGGASGMIVEPVKPFGRLNVTFRADLEGESSCWATLKLRFKGVDFEGVFWRPRGVGAAVLVGECRVADALVGVDCFEEGHGGVPETEPLAERLIPAELAVRDLSRYA